MADRGGRSPRPSARAGYVARDRAWPYAILHLLVDCDQFESVRWGLSPRCGGTNAKECRVEKATVPIRKNCPFGIVRAHRCKPRAKNVAANSGKAMRRIECSVLGWD